ncbi:MAG: NADPH-dependent glutamate synthase [Caldisericota bacterium]|nr:NADPH-dependent glutamate synthase [Caldisericota bacterium]
MKNLNKKQVPMQEQSAKERKNNFNEVPLGYSKKEALLESSRCLQCPTHPCIEGCPVHINIPNFIKAIKEDNVQLAIDIIHESDSLPAVTGRVCPQEDQCQAVCIMGKAGDPIAIGRLERYAADWDLQNRKEGKIKLPAKGKLNNKNVAIVGSGPSGLACAGDLVKKGYNVTVFEGFHKTGGVLIYGIPEFRLPKSIVQEEINMLNKLGIKITTDVLIGRTMTIPSLLKDGFSAVFIGAGAGLPSFMHIPGENLAGVYSANEFLTRVNLMKAYKFPQYDTPIKIAKRVAVIGGGNVAMDSARTALRLGAEHVSLIYRRSRKEMPARNEEILHAEEEGIDFRLLTNPIRYIGNEKGFVKSVECIKMQLGEKDKSGRRRPVPIDDSKFTLDMDQIIVAIGTTPNPIIPRTTAGLKTGRHGVIWADEDGATNIKGIFAGGDIVTGAATVITAMGAGRLAAASINKYLKGNI